MKKCAGALFWIKLRSHSVKRDQMDANNQAKAKHRDDIQCNSTTARHQWEAEVGLPLPQSAPGCICQ